MVEVRIVRRAAEDYSDPVILSIPAQL